MTVRVEHSNPAKTGFLSSGIGLCFGGGMTLGAIGVCPVAVATVTLGLTFVIISMCIPGPWITKYHRVEEEAAEEPVRRRPSRWCCDDMGVCMDISCYSDTPHACHQGRHR